MNTRIFFIPVLFLISFIFISCDGDVNGGEEDPLEIGPVDGIRIAWDYGTLTKIAPRPGRNPGYCGYARMIQLNDGRLACAYESSGGTIEVTYSYDLGESWTWPDVVYIGQNKVPPYVPSIIQLDDGSILVAFNLRPEEPYTEDRRFGIMVRKSVNGGESWKPAQLLYEAQHTFNDGCWEPAMVQLPDGEVQLYFSNEGIYTSSNEQNISMLRSFDNGETWTEIPEIIGFRDDRRDGMPVPLLLPERGEILVSVEDNKEGEFKPTIYREKLSDNWEDGTITADDPRRSYHPLEKPLKLMTYAGGPYLARLHSGEVLLSYQTTLNRQNIWDRSSMTVEIGDDAGTIFNRRSVPFDVPVEQWGLWNSLAVVGDNIPVAITSTNAYAYGNTEVWMIKGRIIPEFSVPQETPEPDGIPAEAFWREPFPYFLGARGPAHLEATLLSDRESLYLAAKMINSEMVDSEDFESSDGIIFQVDPLRNGSITPTGQTYAFHMLPGGTFRVLEGDGKGWIVSGKKDGISLVTGTDGDTTYFELSVSREFLTLDSSTEHRIGVNFVLELPESDLQGPSETIPSNDRDKPYSWCPAILQAE